MDARNRIIMKKRSKLVDARDRLAQLARGQDARVKLQTIRNTRKTNNQPRPFHLTTTATTNDSIDRNFVKYNKRTRLYPDVSRQVESVPFFRDHMFATPDVLAEGYLPSPMPLVRSVKNDLNRFSSPVSRRPERNRNRKNVFDRSNIKRNRADLNLKIIAKNTELTSPGIWKRNYKNDAIVPPSILKKRHLNDTNKATMNGYRILVSNLQSSVTAADIHELFGDIGELTDSKLVRPGTAEVIYSSLKDAQKAVDVYHNRQLDGQPMNCFLVNPRKPSTAPSRPPPSKNGCRVLPASSNSSVIPDVSTVHKVLFGN